MLVPAAAWQRQVSAVMGIEGPGTLGYLRTLAVALVTGGLLVGAARVIKDAIKFLARLMIRRWDINDEVAMFVGTAIVVVLVITLVNGVLVRGFIAGARTVFQPQNASTRPGIEQPVQPERSGSADSFAAWDTLGFQGRNFVATGPHADELAALNGRPAKEPIRIYAGLQSADTTRGRIAVLLSELQRTKAFERKLLVIIPTTGTGWVDPVAARSIESMYNGDTALVAMQYSYLPSWISFLADQQKSVEAGRAMVDADPRPLAAVARRPSAPIGFVRRKSRLDGRAGRVRISARRRRHGLLVGAVGGTAERQPLWKALTVRRDPGTPGGPTALRQRPDRAFRAGVRPRGDRRGGRRAAVEAEPGCCILQHASDPVVWWSPDLLFDKPDWLRRSRPASTAARPCAGIRSSPSGR